LMEKEHAERVGKAIVAEEARYYSKAHGDRMGAEMDIRGRKEGQF